jgi:cephalosporin-C deacetylase
MHRKFLPLILLTVCCGLRAAAVAPSTTINVKPDNETGVYEPGQTVTWSIAVEVEKKPATGKASYRLLLGGLEEIGKGELELNEGKATATGTRKDPGALLLVVKYKAEADPKETTGHGGAIFAPDQIKAGGPAPDDFDQFWKDKIAQLKAIPANPQVKPAESTAANVEYYKITLDNINGTKVYGQMAKPKDGKDLPAMLRVQYAGVYPLNPAWVIDRAKSGWLVLNIMAHDLPCDEPAEFYKKKTEAELKDYTAIGNDDRETTYFLRMFLSCYRAADYLNERPDWNKKTLIVEGGSQGGYQTLVTAALHPAITAYAAGVPAGCDMNGKPSRRASGWPYWLTKQKDPAKMLEASRYYDVVNFAPRIKAPGIIGLGLIDVTCPPEGVFAAINQIKPEKKVVIMPTVGHTGGQNVYWGALEKFLNEQKAK